MAIQDVLTGWTAEALGGLTVALVFFLLRRARRRRGAARPATQPVPGAGALRTYTLIGVRAADGQPVHLPSSRPAGTVLTWPGPDGAGEQFELTDAVLPDGTYAAERRCLYGHGRRRAVAVRGGPSGRPGGWPRR
ncbi:hypothetical protein [Streptomyces toxytricini]|uniref:hypothetical protein n=1 Tax=Streptomyces toxytricini TaxID=67369 RepID=UPI003420E82B